MRKIFLLSFYQFKNDIREFDGFFWSFIFPLILFILLVSISGNISNTENIDIKDFNVGIVYEKDLIGFSKMIIENSFEHIPFKIKEIDNLDIALNKLKEKKINAVLFFPGDFSIKLNTSLLGLKKDTANINLYYIEGRSNSKITKEILNTFLEYINIEILKRIKKVEPVNVKKVSITSEKADFSYKDFVFPGILILSIMSVGFFNIPYNLLFSKEKGINKRLLITPIKGTTYSFALIISSYIMALISSVFVVVEGMLLKVSNKFFTLDFILFYFFSIIVIFSFGLLFTTISRKITTVMAVLNVVFQISMFLGGLYFPVFNVPWVIKWIVYINPITYLVEGLRRIIGFNIAPFSNMWIYLVPLFWLIISLLVFSINYKKVMGYE
ncbi:ABC-2 type transport system permease protein [Marinitoga hydrogenitolerans DSM 16785]|uniref:ABC-2 type transport system permease protein n=1 Tax=Marinitoga hydrogenitolerans (strain DSM 16785 / JCM 12826 / AT1271) TaxID=1122195 RepID=A0A1M4WCE8_MARH1|nr:ABC transporter permease [Marinitoga hydrogenitolerans]SHE78961.1 ABC-2 type transport system permease protein [Marinitoga hydrogenitolerans DSM 16785]